MPLLENVIIGGIVQPIWTDEDIESVAFKYSIDETINTIDNRRKKINIATELNNYLIRSKIILPTPFAIDYSCVTYMVDSNLTRSYTSTIQMGVDGVIRVYRNVDDKGQPIKLGKLLRVLNPSILDHDIESIVSNHKKKYTIDTSKVKVSNNINNIYNVSSCGGSCMAHKGQYMDIYKDVGCSIAYLIEDKILKARAILWHDLEVTPDGENGGYNDESMYIINMMDRVFFNNEKDKLTLEHWAKENGYVYYKDVVGRIETSRIIKETYDYAPYVDTLPFVTSYYKLSNVDDDYIDMLKEADGTSSSNNICSRSNQIYCEDTGNYVDEDSDYYYLIDDGVCWESNDDLVYVSDRGWYRADNSNIVYCEDIQEYVTTRHDTVYEVEELDCYYYNDDDLVEIDDTYYHVDSDSICYAENVQEYRLLADCFLGEDEKYYA